MEISHFIFRGQLLTFFLALSIALKETTSWSFGSNFLFPHTQSRSCVSLEKRSYIVKRAAESNDGDGSTSDKENEGISAVPESVIRVDDGGSDLTDRFKYKVNALMGTYDPIGGATDDENQTGNILNAMLTFPARYSFNVVGKTGGDSEIELKYVEEVKAIVSGAILRDDDKNQNADNNKSEEVSFFADDEDLDKPIEYEVKPRGKNFVKVSVLATVESAAVISSIYKSLAEMELTVMSF